MRDVCGYKATRLAELGQSDPQTPTPSPISPNELTGVAPSCPFIVRFWVRGGGDSGWVIKEKQYRFFFPPPREGKGGKRTIPSPLKLPGVYTHGGTDSGRPTNSALSKSGAGTWHTPMDANLCQLQGTPWDKGTNQRHPNQAKYNIFLEKNVQVLFNPESGFKVVEEPGYATTWNVSEMVWAALVLQPSQCFSSSVQLLISIMM